MKVVQNKREVSYADWEKIPNGSVLSWGMCNEWFIKMPGREAFSLKHNRVIDFVSTYSHAIPKLVVDENPEIHVNIIRTELSC